MVMYMKKMHIQEVQLPLNGAKAKTQRWLMKLLFSIAREVWERLCLCASINWGYIWLASFEDMKVSGYPFNLCLFGSACTAVLWESTKLSACESEEALSAPRGCTLTLSQLPHIVRVEDRQLKDKENIVLRDAISQADHLSSARRRVFQAALPSLLSLPLSGFWFVFQDF